MRTEPPKNHVDISAKIWQFWIGHSTAYTRVLYLQPFHSVYQHVRIVILNPTSGSTPTPKSKSAKMTHPRNSTHMHTTTSTPTWSSIEFSTTAHTQHIHFHHPTAALQCQVEGKLMEMVAKWKDNAVSNERKRNRRCRSESQTTDRAWLYESHRGYQHPPVHGLITQRKPLQDFYHPSSCHHRARWPFKQNLRLYQGSDSHDGPGK